MSTIRRGPLPTDHFTIISNDWMRDSRLPFAAKGLLAWLAGHADGFDITEEAIIAVGPDGRGAIRTMTKALEEAGYLRRERAYSTEGGSTVDYLLSDPREGKNCLPEKGQNLPPRSEQEGQDVPAGQPEGQNSPLPSSPEDQEKNKKTSSSSRAPRLTTATRIPDDFIPDVKMRDWFADEKLHHVIDARIEHEKFMDYFRAAPGVKGRKLDWPATWRNWMRSAADRASRYGSTRPVSAPPGTSLVPSSGAPLNYRPSTTDQKVAQTLDLGRRLQAMEDSK